jgi:hypothetical protein
MDLQKEYLKIARAFVEPWKKDNNVVGVSLGGGVSRGTGDEFSEIDVYFYVKDKKKSKLPPKIKGIGNDINVNGVWFEFKICEIGEERKKVWGMVDRWEGTSYKILFERREILTKLYRDKVKFEKGEREKLLKEFSGKAGWCLQLADLFGEARKDLFNAHMLLNESIDSFVDYYFISRGKFIPHYKWKHYYFQGLEGVSSRAKRAIFAAYRIKDYSLEELRRRLAIIKKEIIFGDLGEDYFGYHAQDLGAVKNFVASLKRGIKYENPFVKDVSEKV